MRVGIVGASCDFGADRRGVDMGPSAIRYAGLQVGLERLGHDVVDAGNVVGPPAESRVVRDPRLKYLDEIVALNSSLCERVAALIADERLPVVLGGDHSIALGSVTAATVTRRLGLVWLDAHGDFNTAETTLSGNIHGMPLAALAGLGEERLVTLGREGRKVAPERMVLVGTRDLDDGEKRLLKEHGVGVYTMKEVDRLGMGTVMAQAIQQAAEGMDGLHVSVDLDVVDPRDAPGVGTPVRGGISYREAHLALEMIAESGLLRALDLVEVNPILDQYNTTGQLAAELAWSALGKRIL
ncbi:MAG: arginase [Chloroflexota bacterium]